MTDTHAGNGGTKVVDQLLIDISTGDSSVVGSQISAQDNIQTIDSRKSVPRKRLTSEATAKTTTISVLDEPNDINYDLGGGNVHSGERFSQEEKR